MKALVDGGAVLAVEGCLLKGVPKLLSPSIVSSLDDEAIFAIAAESEDAQAERARVEVEFRVLTMARSMPTRLTQTHPRESHDIRSLDSSTMSSCSPADVAPLSQATAPQRPEPRCQTLSAICQTTIASTRTSAAEQHAPTQDQEREILS